MNPVLKSAVATDKCTLVFETPGGIASGDQCTDIGPEVVRVRLCNNCNCANRMVYPTW